MLYFACTGFALAAIHLKLSVSPLLLFPFILGLQ